MEALLSVRRACIAWVLLLAAGTVPSAQAPSSRQHSATDSQPRRSRVELGSIRRGRAPAESARPIPSSIALRARAQIAQGHYQEAQTLLTPVASAQPDSDAALELGLLELVSRVAAQTASAAFGCLTSRLAPRTARDYFRLARAASALAGFPGCSGVQGSQQLLPRRQQAGSRRSRHQCRVGRAVPRQAQSRRRDEVVPGGASRRRQPRRSARLAPRR